MTTTVERTRLLVEHCNRLSSENFLGRFHVQDLLDWIESELGNTKILDQFVNYGSGKKSSKAIPNDPILHILSENTPHAGLQSLLRGLLIGAMNIVKLPSNGLTEVSEWVEALPYELRDLVQIVDNLNKDTFCSAKTVIAIGSDTTMTEIQRRISPTQRFIPHGHKLSIGLVKSPTQKTAELVVRDACAFNQRGCLSLHTVYVIERAKEFLPMIAEAMREFELANPRGQIGMSESGAISNLRETIRYEAANDPENISLLHSEGNTSWTAFYRNSPTLIPSVLNRVIAIQPWPGNIDDLGTEREFLSTLALEKSLFGETSMYDIPRICPLGQSQSPDLSWHHDGFSTLCSLVRWRDIESL